ncbi:hypothetical protein GCM10011609_83040 [Lentzea pudingi]|uniref:WXG100 family type VII secretion target n=1 Tax=Lentzea pudingi TaxID=1789439 RepID=A0ABQ2IVI0_9PSEU|nr:hypothetical protein [Lentzea pudingi]GGN27586.1 hypothetical protein GCM10011609_83040 [Lentzea pudingi]
MADQTEIKKLLDDPNVTPETKKQLVRALAGAGAPQEEVERYGKANGVDVPDDPSVGDHVVGVLLAAPTMGLLEGNNIRKEAQHAAFTMEGGEADKLVKKAGEERELGATQKVLNEQGDVPNSNTLLDAGAPGLRFFEKFIPVYAKAAPACGHQGAAPNLEGDIYRKYDEVRDIDFAKFREDAHKITENVKKAEAHDNALGSAWNGLGSWEGPAAQAARAYQGKFAGASKQFVQQAGTGPGAITGGVTNMQKHVKDFAQQIHDQYSDTCGGLTVEKAEEAIRQANGDVFPNDGGVLDWVYGVHSEIKNSVIGAICGGPLGILSGLGWGGWIADVRDKIISDAKEKLKALCAEFDGKKKAFDGYCQAVQTGVEADYKAMFTGMKGAFGTDPFGPVGDAPSFTEQGGGGQQKVDNGGGGGGSPSGGGGPSGGGAPSGGGGGTPEIPKPENPLDKDGDGKPDVPGDTDGDGKPDDLDGDGKPDEPKPEEKLETVTVTAGDNTIKVTEPDSNGHVKMTIDTPKGEPKTYDLDFSKNPEAAKALMGQNGAQAITAMANQLTASNPTAGAQTPAAGGAPAPGGGAAPAAGGPLGSESNPIPVEVGEDGKIHIEQDGVNFTAEVNADTGEINLTADDGDGTPDKVGVSFGEDENPAAQTPGSESGSGAGGADGARLEDGVRLEDGLRTPEGDFPDEVRTLPAEADFQPMPAPAGEQVWSAPGEAAPNVAERFQDSMARSYIEDNGIMPSVGEPRIPAESPQFAQATDSTTTSGVSFTGGAGGGSESVLGSSADTAWTSPNSGDSNGGSFNTNTSEAGQPGSANLPTMQDAHGQSPSGAASGGMMGGGMMGGGMGGAGAGGQQGGDSERGASQWRTTGTLFDDDNSNPLSAMQTTLGEDRGEAANPWR